MLKIYKKVIVLLFIVLIIFNAKIALSDIIIINDFSDIIENSKKYDGKEVIVKGEVIGEALKRKDGVWINISDGSVAMGLFAKEGLLKKIETYGNYNYTGDILEARGIFHKACLDHDGEIDFHAEEVKVISKGSPLNHHISKKRIIIVFVTTILLLVILRIFTGLKKYKNI